ncbi:Procollagen-lysine,2-oxoglutarate 5-dioxygenase [Dirofilaria immitis]|nr:Procollagen-lysine,2-oxoglutarate 5-dioxygenase [Dirofilaria immitis]
MYSLVMLLLFLVSASLTDKCDSSAYKLVIFALSNDYNDALERFRCSTKRYNIDFEIFDFGQSSNRHGNRREIGKLLRMLAGKLKIFGASNSTILLIIDGFDAIIASDENDIICLFLNACSNCRALLTPKATPNQDEILSIALMGFVPNVLNVLDFIGSQDGKTLSYNGLYSDDSMNTLGLTFDVKEYCFKILMAPVLTSCSYSTTVAMHMFVHNFLRNTHPSIILGSNKGSQLLNYLGNYIGKAWSVENGYQQCGSRSLLQTTNDTLPSITLALFINKPIPFVREFLAAINRMSYPASKIDLYVYNSQKYNEKDIEEFLKNAKKLYRTVEYDSNDTELGEKKRERLPCWIFTEELLNDFVFMLDGDVHLIIPETLQLLVETATVGNFNIIAPLLTLHGKLFSNFWGALDSNGYYSRSEDYIEIVDRKRVGVWNVPYISKAILINKSKVKMLENSYTYNVMVDTDMSFCEYARAMGYFMHVDNQRYYGFLVDTEDFINNDGRLHPEMYEIFKNRHIWEQRYIHPKYYEALDSRDIHQSCPDGNRLADEYEIVPTVDIHMSQINFEKEWSYFLDEYVRPMQEKLFIGYYQKRGKDYEGGGIHYVRYNCTVSDDQTGYATMFPGRLTHLHEGLPVTSGTRYIAMSFLNP